MPISPMYFQPLSFDQNNPFLTGMKGGEQLVGGALNNQATSLANQLAKAQLPYASDMSQAELLAKQLSNQYAPMKYGTASMNAQSKAAQVAIQNANSYRQYAGTPQGQKLLQADPGFRDAYQTAMRNEAAMISGGFNPAMPGGSPSGQLDQTAALAQQLPTQQLAMAPVQQQPAIQNGAPQSGNVPGTLSAPSDYNQLPLNPDQTNKLKALMGGLSNSQQSKNDQAIQEGTQDSYIVKNYPKDTQKRLQAGERYQQTAQQVMQDFDNGASSYFSPQGQAQLKIDQASAAKGHVPENLQSYRNFVQGIEQLKVQGAMLEGVPADQISRSQYAKVFDLSKFANTSDGARNQLVNGINLGLKADEANKKSPGALINTPTKLYSASQPTAKNSATQNNSGAAVTVQMPDGKKWQIPKDKLDAAIKRGAKQI
jgi:hypothetical protein